MFFYIVYEMRFKDKTYGLNHLVAHWVAIRKKVFPHSLCLFLISKIIQLNK